MVVVESKMIFAFASRPFDKVLSVSVTKDLHCCDHFFQRSECCNKSLITVNWYTEARVLQESFDTVIWSNLLSSLMNHGDQTAIPNLLILFDFKTKSSYEVQKRWKHCLHFENLTECRLLDGKLAPRAFLTDDAEVE